MQPTLSIIVIPLGGSIYLPRCLTALARQRNAGSPEIIVSCDDRLSDVPALQAQFPTVTFLPAAGRHTCAELRARGVKKAAGSIIAITEDHCIPIPDWCANILRAHQQPHAAIGGAVDKTGPDTALNWAFYLADYVRYANPRPAGPVEHLTDCNVAYKRTALESIAAVWQTEFHEPDVHAALRTAGYSLWLSPDITVHQQRSLTLHQAIRDRYAFGRLFGSRRAAGLPPMRRMVYAAIAAALPLLLTARVAQHVFARGRYRAAFVRSLPALALVNTIWTWGEFTGYLTGRAEASLSPTPGLSRNPQ